MTVKDKWYQTFFTGLVTEYWHQAVAPEFTDIEVKLILKETGLQPSSRVLDIACGSGRHALALAKMGFTVTGIDIAASNIDLLRQQAIDLPVTAVCADVLEYPFEGLFDLAVCMGNSFNFLPYNRMMLFAEKLNKALRPGARFIISTGLLAESLLPDLKQRSWAQVNDIFLLMTNTYHPDEGVLQTEMLFVKNGTVSQQVAYGYVFTLAEFGRLLSAAGFKNIVAYGNVAGAPYRLGDQHAYIVCEKG